MQYISQNGEEFLRGRRHDISKKMKKNAHLVSDIIENYRVDRERKKKMWGW